MPKPYLTAYYFVLNSLWLQVTYVTAFDSDCPPGFSGLYQAYSIAEGYRYQQLKLLCDYPD